MGNTGSHENVSDPFSSIPGLSAELQRDDLFQPSWDESPIFVACPSLRSLFPLLWKKFLFF